MFRNMPIPPVLLTAVEVKECRITLAARFLAAKPDLKTMKRDNFKSECIAKFRITGRDYQFQVWPSARRLAGLPKSARPGPKKQKIIVTPIRT